MRTKLLLIFFVLSFFLVQAQVPVVKFPEIEKILENKNDTTYILNFWATWCKPCVKEMPYFVKLDEKQAGKKIKVILVSLDYKRDLETRLIPFIQKNSITSTVWLLDELNYNQWIDKVDSSWDGGIPATLVVRNQIKKIYPHEFESYDDLEKILTL